MFRTFIGLSLAPHPVKPGRSALVHPVKQSLSKGQLQPIITY